MPIADSVRLALPADAAQIAALQRRAWAITSPGLKLPDDAEETWWMSITAPPLAQCRVLVATGASGVVGFATVSPSADPDAETTDGEIGEFIADGEHADRLLHACIDTLRKDGFTRARWWLHTHDDVRRAWLEEAGWAADGAHREFRDEEARLKMVRLHTSLD